MDERLNVFKKLKQVLLPSTNNYHALYDWKPSWTYCVVVSQHFTCSDLFLTQCGSRVQGVVPRSESCSPLSLTLQQYTWIEQVIYPTCQHNRCSRRIYKHFSCSRCLLSNVWWLSDKSQKPTISTPLNVLPPSFACLIAFEHVLRMDLAYVFKRSCANWTGCLSGICMHSLCVVLYNSVLPLWVNHRDRLI